MMYYLRVSDAFDAAHFLSGYTGKCKNIHGHRWKVVIEVKGAELQKSGVNRSMLTDFADINTISFLNGR